MSYVEKSLLPDERVVHWGNLHWAIYLPGFILLPAFGLGLLFLVSAWVRKATTELAVTDARVIIKTGWMSRRTIEMNIAKVENIQVDQGLFGRVFDYGTITVVGTGGTREPFSHIRAPLEFRRAVQSQVKT